MGVSGGPNVVTDGLVLDLDAANAQSYPNYYNLLRYSQQFNSWTQDSCTVGADAVTAPDGTLTADSFTELATTAQHLATQNISWVSGSTYTFSTYAKAGNQSTLCLVMSYTAFGLAWRTAYFNLSTGTVTSNNNNSGVSPTITSVGNGWYRCTFTCTCTTSVTDKLAAGKDFFSHLGDGQINLYLWGAQLELGTQASPYQQIGASYITKWSDLSPTLISGSLINGTYYNVYSTPTKAMTFDGVDDYVNTTFNSSLNDFSVCSWFKNNSSTGYARIADKNYQTGFWFGQNGVSANQWGGGVRQTNNYNFLTLSNNDWHFLAMTRTGTSLIVYGDGITNTNTTVCGSGAIDTTLLSLGATVNTGAGQVDWFKGTIATLQIYNRTLSATEILQNYNATKGRFGL